MRGRSLEKVLGCVLLIFVILGLLLNIAGMILHLLETNLSLEVKLMNGDTILLLKNLPEHIYKLDSYGVLSLGILFIILTPYARIIISMVYFISRRDYKYTLITFIVFTIITIIIFIR